MEIVPIRISSLTKAQQQSVEKNDIDGSCFENYADRANGAEAGMRVISKARLRQFWESPVGRAAEGSLRAWHSHVNHHSVSWDSWANVRADYPSASLVGNCTVFNIGGNKYRLVTRVLFVSQKVFVLKAMTHAEYDEDKWKTECGCYAAPPGKSARKVVRRSFNHTNRETKHDRKDSFPPKG
jgi:mRNA interferase HigB